MDIAIHVLLKDVSNAQKILESRMAFVFHVLIHSTIANLVATETLVRNAMSMLLAFSMEGAQIVIMGGQLKVDQKNVNALMTGLFKSL